MKIETIEESAEKWVFETNGHKWSNNDDSAGDNYGSFITGFKCCQEQTYSKEEVESIWKFALYSAEQHDKFGNRNKSYFIKKDVEEFIEEFKKK